MLSISNIHIHLDSHLLNQTMCVDFDVEKHILLSYWVTVKAATLIFIFGRGSTISSAQEGRSIRIYMVNTLFEPHRSGAFHKNHDTNHIQTENHIY